MTVAAANLPPEFPGLAIAFVASLAACFMLACIEAALPE